MNKKLLIGILAGIIALAVIIVGIVLVVGTIDGSRPSDSDTSATSSVVDKDNSSSDATGSSENATKEENLTSGINSAAENDDTLAADVIEVPVNMTKNPGVLAGMLTFEYDAESLTCVGYKNESEIMQVLIDPQYASGKVSIIMDAPEMEDTTDTGTLITLLFKAKKDAKAGDYEIKLGADTQFSNYDEQLVEPTLDIEKVTVK